MFCTMDKEKAWKLTIIHHFGKRKFRRWREFMLDLLCVECGIKPALLFDYSTPDVTSMSLFIKNLEEQRLLQCQNLKIIAIDMDVLIVNSTCFADVGDESTPAAEETFSKYFIDVSSYLSHPWIIADTSKCVINTWECFQKCVQKLNSSSIGSILLIVDRNELVNPSTLFGMFLGYPVVYWYDMYEGSQQNCLSFVPLCNFILKGTVAVNVALKAGEDQTDSDRQSGEIDVFEHTIMSFSVPESLVEMVSDHIESWFRGLRTNQTLWSSLFDELKLEKKRVQMSTFCL